jgi:hypothetical protein
MQDLNKLTTKRLLALLKKMRRCGGCNAPKWSLNGICVSHPWRLAEVKKILDTREHVEK